MNLPSCQTFTKYFPAQQGCICPLSDKNCARNGLNPGDWGTCGQRSLRRPRVLPPIRRVLQSCWRRFPRPEPAYPFEDGPKERSRYGHLRHLEDDVPRVGDNLRPDLEAPLGVPEGSFSRSVVRILWRHVCARNLYPPSRGNRGKMKFSAAGPAGSYGKGGHYGNTFARAKASALGKGGGAPSPSGSAP